MVQRHVAKHTKGSTPFSNPDAQQNGFVANISPAPHPTRVTRTAWKAFEQPDDPIAHLMRDLHQMGALLNDQFQILIFNEAPIDILETPYQYLSDSILEAAARARTLAAEGT